MLDDDKINQPKVEGWEEYEEPQPSEGNWAKEKAGFEENRALAQEFKDFMQDNFISLKSNNPLLSQGAQIIVDAIEKLPIHFKNDHILKLSKLKELKSESQDSYIDFTNKYIEEFRNITKAFTTRTKEGISCYQALEEVIKSKKEKEEIKAQKDRQEMYRLIADEEWKYANVNPKVKLVSSIEEAMSNLPKSSITRLAEEASKEVKKANKFFSPYVRGSLDRVRNVLSPSKKKGPQR